MKALFSVVAALLMTSAVAFADEPVSRRSLQWSDNLSGSFSKAVSTKKPLVVLFTDDESSFSEQLVREVLETSTLDSFADSAIYVRAKGHYEDVSGNYARLRKELGITRVPMLVMLEATTDALKETGRIDGYYPADEYSLKFANLMEEWDAKKLKALSSDSASAEADKAP